MENLIEMDDDKVFTLLKDTREGSISKKRKKIIRAVIAWFTRHNRWTDRNELLKWFIDGNIKEPTVYQLNTERRLQELLPALFENHGDLTFADKENRTPLHCCIEKMKYCNEEPADRKLVSALCNLGMSVAALDDYGYSPLGIALDMRRWDLVEVLIRSASKNLADRNKVGQSALHILIYRYYDQIDDYKKCQVLVMKLLRKGADVNQPDEDGVTPVHLAANKMDIELLRKFKENGANLNCRTNCGDDLLITICKTLVPWQVDESLVLELIDWLVDLPGFRADVKNSQGFTALHYAAKSENIEIIKRLIRVGVDLHAVSHDDTNVLHLAAVSSNFEVLQHLIQQNVDFRRRDNVYGFSLLHLAALSAEPRICEWLVKEKRLDVDDLGKFQLTPLHLASMLGNAKVVRKLIECDADVHRTDDKFHRTALHLASMTELSTIFRDFRANGDEIKYVVSEWSLVDDCFDDHRLFGSNIDHNATVVALLDASTKVDATDIHGCTALHYATRNYKGDHIVASLLKSGAHVDVQDNKCWTPMQNSVVNNNCIGLINLLTFGSNINDIAHEICRKVKTDRATGRAIVEHLLRLKTAGLPVDECFKDILDDFGCMVRPSNYSSELAKMKKRMLTDEVSLYDVLHMSFKRRSRFANSLPRDIETEFPNYYVVLQGKCNEAVNRMALFEPAREAFKWMTSMPDICIDIIMSFMSNVSLRVLIDAAGLTEY